MRVLSYNIHKGIGGRDRRYDLDRVCRVIEAENPDFICLQEVTQNAPRTGHDDQPRLLADRFAAVGLSFQMNVHYRVGGYGNLLLSRWPFQSRHHVSLRYRDKKPRGVQLAVVATPFGPFHLANWHLGLAEKERHWQVNHLLKHALFGEAAILPTLIVGDSNDWRNSLCRGPLRFGDFESVAGPPSRFRSFPAYLSVLSLDKAYCRGGIVVENAHIVRSRLARVASDHLPLVVDFKLVDPCQTTA